MDIVYLPIHPAEAVFGHAADGSLPEKGEIHSQAGFLVFITTTDLAEGKEAKLNLIAGRSGKIDRIVAGSLSAEACGMVGSCAACEWVQHAYFEMAGANYSAETFKKRLHRWEAGEAVKDAAHFKMLRTHCAFDQTSPLHFTRIILLAES